MKQVTLNFVGYWREGNEGYIPQEAGIYCVYSCTRKVRDKKSFLRIKRLLYIGESQNVNERIANHEHYLDWEEKLNDGEILCFSFAEVENESDRKAAEAGLIYTEKPAVNALNKNN